MTWNDILKHLMPRRDLAMDNKLTLQEEIADLKGIIHDQEEYITDLESQVIMLEKQIEELVEGDTIQ